MLIESPSCYSVGAGKLQAVVTELGSSVIKINFVLMPSVYVEIQASHGGDVAYKGGESSTGDD